MSHRALLLASLAPGTSQLHNVLVGEDTRATAAAIEALGASFAIGDAMISAEDMPAGQLPVLSVRGGDQSPPKGTIECGNSGSTLRMVSAIASVLNGTTRLDGDDSLRSRPNDDLLAALEMLGVNTVSHEGCAPLSVTGPWTGTRTRVSGSVSSQFVTGLLLAGLGRGLELTLTSALRSSPYVDLTLEMSRLFGTDVHRFGDTFQCGPAPTPSEVVVPGDFSSAAFPLALAVLRGESITMDGLAQDSRQGDRVFLNWIGEMGADIVWSDGILDVTGRELVAGDFDLSSTPDLLPIMSVVAACAKGTTTLHNVAHARVKESDRIAAMARNLSAMGVQLQEMEDGLEIIGGPIRGASLRTEGDHRILMACTVAAVMATGKTTLDNANCNAVSYPGFWEDLREMGVGFENG